MIVKKYWKLIFLTLFIVITFSLFYINYANVTDTFPQYRMDAIEGDETLGQNVSFHGDYYHGMISMEPFQVNERGTTYLREMPFFNRLHHSYLSPEIEGWQKEYRSFMRGKDEDLQMYYED